MRQAHPRRLSRLSSILGPEAHPVAAHGLYAVLYTAAVILGRLAVAPATGVALVWPAAGVAFVWYLVAFAAADGRAVRRRMEAAAAISATIVLVTTVLNVASDMPVDKAVVYAAGNAVAAALAAWAHRLASRRDRWWLTRVRHLSALLLASAVAGVASAACGPLYSALVDGSSAAIWQGLTRTGIGTLFFGAILLRAISPVPDVPPSATPARAGVAALTVVGYLVTLWVYPHLPITFVLTCVTVVAGVLFTVDGVVWFLMTTGSVILLTSMADIGPFGIGGAVEEVFIAQGFVGAQLVVGLLLALGREGITRLLGVVSEARRQAETQSGLLHVVLTGMSDAVVAVDGDRVLHGNRAAAAMFGLQAGDRVEPGVLWSGDPGGDAPLDRAVRGVPVTEDLVHELEGTRHVLSVRAHPLGGGDGRAVLVARDVTEHRRHVAELSSFASVVAHDLLNPIGGVEGWLEVVEDELGDTAPAARRGVDRAKASAARARDIVTGLHSYSVARGGELAIADVDLHTLVADLARGRAAAGEVAANPPRISVDAHVWVRADRVLLGQVVDNLLGNAIKYSRPDTRPQIEVTAQVVEGVVRVRVDDDGIGIPVAEREHVFEEFHRVPDHRRGAAGTGLGLSICRRMIERHGGTIEAQASPAGGTRIEFTLPLGLDPTSLVEEIAAQNRAATASVGAVRARRPHDAGSARR